jgi:hypothetical protein
MGSHDDMTAFKAQEPAGEIMPARARPRSEIRGRTELIDGCQTAGFLPKGGEAGKNGGCSGRRLRGKPRYAT